MCSLFTLLLLSDLDGKVFRIASAEKPNLLLSQGKFSDDETEGTVVVKKAIKDERARKYQFWKFIKVDKAYKIENVNSKHTVLVHFNKKIITVDPNQEGNINRKDKNGKKVEWADKWVLYPKDGYYGLVGTADLVKIGLGKDSKSVVAQPFTKKSGFPLSLEWDLKEVDPTEL